MLLNDLYFTNMKKEFYQASNVALEDHPTGGTKCVYTYNTGRLGVG